MLPYFQLGPWSVNTYAFLYALMYLLVGILGFRRLRRLPYPATILGNLVLVTILSVVIGSLLPVLFATLQGYFQTGIWSWGGQVRLLGGMAAGITVAVLCIRREGLPLGKTLDLGILPFPLGMAIGRLGCFAAGCCYGAATESWLGMYLRDNTGAWYTRYPTQLMSAAADLGIFLVLVAVEHWKASQARRGIPTSLFDGALLVIFVFLYCLKRLFIQFLRFDYAPILGPLDATQLICLTGLAAATTLLIGNFRAQRTTGRGPRSER
jgi:phosphatidylglycerol---prolipoprotein diacylglyceryl transferase